VVITTRAYLLIVAALAAERVVELALSARNRKLALAAGAIECGRDHYLFMSAFHVLFLLALVSEKVWLRHPFPPVIGWIAVGGAVAAQALRYWAVVTLGARWNTRIIIFPNAAPVTAGPYRYLRHPNYLAVIIEMACVPMIGGCWLTAMVFSLGNAVLLTVRIREEEKSLGKNYARTMGSLPRLFPSLSVIREHMLVKRSA
jgi:methyltransferase